MSALFHEDEKSYHQRTDCMSSHRLATFRRDPAVYHAEQIGDIERRETDAMRFGRAAHCYILERRDEFSRRYTVHQDIVGQTGYLCACFLVTRPIGKQEAVVKMDMAGRKYRYASFY